MIIKMLILSLVPLLCLQVCFSTAADVTFKNVTFRGYNMYTEKFKKSIPSSNSLKDFLPKTVFDKIEFQDQEIPVIYKNALADLDSLDELVIENCGVYEIKPGALKNVPYLRRLSLKGNRLEEIKEGVFNNLELSVLDLSRNYITTIQTASFDNMPNLLHISLSDNEIANWNKNWFQHTPLLSRISMQNNSLDSLPDGAFQNLKGIKMFGKVDISVSLVFSYNKIEQIDPKALRGLTRIRNLWLDHNQLREVDSSLWDNVKIDHLRIDHNKITCLKGDYNEVFKAESTHIDSNPFDCDCLESIKSFVKTSTKEVDFFFTDMDCTAQRIRKKMDAVEKRLKEISLIGKDDKIEEETNDNVTAKYKPIK